MTRDQIIDALLNCATIAECDTALAASRSWLRDHPEDWQVMEVGEVALKTRDALVITGMESATNGD